MKTKTTKEDVVEQALIKKAVGYDAKEIIEEYCFDNETKEEILSKKKVAVRHYSPDINAIKILLGLNDKTDEELESMTDEELLKERDLLLEKLKKEGEK